MLKHTHNTSILIFLLSIQLAFQLIRCVAFSVNSVIPKRKTSCTNYFPSFLMATASVDEMMSIFSSYSDENELMTKLSLLEVPMISELMSDGDLLESEFEEFWSLAPKCPEGNLIDFDSFVQIYKQIDDLFEDDDNATFATSEERNESNDSLGVISTIESETGDEDESNLTAVFQELCSNERVITKEKLEEEWTELVKLLNDNLVSKEEVRVIWDQSSDKGKMDLDGFIRFNLLLDELFEFEEENMKEDANDLSLDKENIDYKILSKGKKNMIEGDDLSPEVLFYSLVNSDNLVGKGDLGRWKELQEMLKEGYLSEEELDDFFKTNADVTVEGANDLFLNEKSFITMFNSIEDLFEEDKDNENISDSTVSSKEWKAGETIEGNNIPSGVLFYSLANPKNLVGIKELAYWQELQEMLKDGDLLEKEFLEFFEENALMESNGELFLNEDGFSKMYDRIENLFDYDEDEEEGAEEENDSDSGAKQALLDLFDELEIERRNTSEDVKDRLLPCGLNAKEEDDKLVGNIVSALEQEPRNIIKKMQGRITPGTLVGDWKLLYSTSSAMKFNKGLSGIGGSFPNGKFGGLIQKLKYSKFMQDIEYVEQIDVKPSSASFQVLVNGSWELKQSISLFTNQPCTTLYVEPDRVMYGPTSTRGDHWKSLGPLNMLDVTYLDEDLRIMRGNTATDAIFVFRRISGD